MGGYGVGLFGISACTSFQTVHLHGQLKDMGTQNVIMRYNGAAALLGDSRDIILHTDTEGNFDTILPLERPEYYSINRNTLWLEPGDDLKVMLPRIIGKHNFRAKGRMPICI